MLWLHQCSGVFCFMWVLSFSNIASSSCVNFINYYIFVLCYVMFWWWNIFNMLLPKFDKISLILGCFILWLILLVFVIILCGEVFLQIYQNSCCILLLCCLAICDLIKLLLDKGQVNQHNKEMLLELLLMRHSPS